MGLNRRSFENGIAWLGFASVVGGVILVILRALRVIDDESMPLALLMVAGGSALFYGFGCFRIWPGDEPAAGQRSAIWFVHQYWLNGFGSIVGWAAGAVLVKRYAETPVGEFTFSFGEFFLGLVAFLGLVGYLPFMATGFAVTVRELAKKILDKV
jgi:hypothetical protein